MAKSRAGKQDRQVQGEMGFEARVHGPAYYDEGRRVLAELGSHRSCRLGTRSNCLFNAVQRPLFDSSTSLSLFVFRPLPIANLRLARLRPNPLPAITLQEDMLFHALATLS